MSLTLYNHTVNYIQRLGISIDSGLTTYADRGGRTRSTGSADCRHTGSTPLKGLVKIGDNRTLNLVFTHGNGSAGKVAFLHRTVPHNHHFVQHLGVFLQRDVHCCLVRYLYFLADIAYKGDYNGSSRFHIQGKVTVNVGNYTIRCTFFQYIGTDNRAHSITDDTRNFLCLLHCLNGIRR